ncbi:MAG: four-carbon acid sugar kinase family protein [Pseudomonadota bacterium]
MVSVVILADDLTGALDSAVCFANRGMTTVVAGTVDAFAEALRSGCDVVAVSTSSREISAEQARQKITEALGCVCFNPLVLMKKVDSRLKGNIKVELDVFSEKRLKRNMFVCPAVPSQGRLVEGGRIVGKGVSEPIDVSDILPGEFASDSITNAQNLSDIVLALPLNLEDYLFVGAAGLAEALAIRLRPEMLPRPSIALPSPALFAIGSRDPITKAQLDKIRPVCDIIEVPNGQNLHVYGKDRRRDVKVTIVEMVAGNETVSGTEAGRAFSSGIAREIRRNVPATILACGGETAAAILNEAGMKFLTVKGEVLPGMPFAETVLNNQKIIVVTKSGGFGTEDTFENVLSLIA